MSRLNAMIKLIVMGGEAMFLLVAFATAIMATIVLSGNIMALSFPEAKRIAKFTLLVMLLIICCTLYGCYGVVNQIVRKGCLLCRGRRILCCHQVMLLIVLVVSFIQQEQLAQRENSIEVVIDNGVTTYPRYDAFEKKLGKYFSKTYFEANCADENDKSSKWLMEWVDNNCPVTMKQNVCKLTKYKKETCDTSCPETIWSAEKCCPSEKRCFEFDIQESCPYDQCREAVLEYVFINIKYVVHGLRFVCILTATMIIFTCLLICYNPRDEIEMELLKTGVMTKEDIEVIRKLKSQRNFSYDKGNGNGRHSIDLDTIHATRSVSNHAGSLSQPTRRGIRLMAQNGNNRVYPIDKSSP